ncbi:response regulator [Caulobacter mirabilis]|uniref:Response regulatory domain-containing protein n=1 Tax=Caulobacter mirabilis TaxID=69666 RepID=A0A2D2AVJ4_9CAUL|nr:response regulator [Caulobacter mirabilis]ATQ42030.1 hypothetical protein CSW64_06175 [Caulobacter mirabilis]
MLVAMLGGFGLRRVQRSRYPSQIPLWTEQGFDLIFVGVTAINLHELDSISALRRSVDHPSRTAPVVVMSSYTPRSLIERAREAGATFVLSKPLQARTVFDRILWLAKTPREFVDMDAYFGPDRRMRDDGPPLGEADRRAGDPLDHAAAIR